jgi:LysM repeat protein
MDTISRENNSYLPVAGVIAGVLAVILSVVALVKLSKVGKTVDGLTDSVAKIDSLEGEVRNSTQAAEKANSGIASLQRSSNDAFSQVAQQLGDVRGEIDKLKEAQKAPPPKLTNAKGEKGEKAPKEPPVAGPGEYVVKSGDSGAKIARANAVSLADLQAVNPGVNWTKLKVGDKVKLPAKK